MSNISAFQDDNPWKTM